MKRYVERHTLEAVPSLSLLSRLSIAAIALVGCSGGVPIDVSVGPLSFDVDVSRIAVPPSLQSSGAITRIACSVSSMCPSAPGLALQCVAGACDPDPIAFDLSSVVDLSTYSSELSTVGANLSSIYVSAMSWQGSTTGLRVPVGPIEVFWGPEAASGVGSDGVRKLGTIPVIRVDASGMSSGEIALDAAGNAALSNHLLNVSRRFRFFARALVDLAPGGALPAGRASLQVRMRVHAESMLLR